MCSEAKNEYMIQWLRATSPDVFIVQNGYLEDPRLWFHSSSSTGDDVLHRALSEKKLEEIKKDIDHSKNLKGFLKIFIEPLSLFVIKIPNVSKKIYGDLNRNTNDLPVFIPVCSVCKRLIESISYEALPDNFRHMDSYYLRD